MSTPSLPPAPSPPVFTYGSTLRHVLAMTASGTIGLLAIFSVDFLSLLYISWLDDLTLTAGVGFATQVSFICLSVNIGLSIGVAALVSRRIGAGDPVGARVLAGSALCHSLIIATFVSVLVYLLSGKLLLLLGATGEIYQVASHFVSFTILSNIPLALGIVSQGLLRAAGDARRAMYVTLTGAMITAALDPLLIFGFHLGLDGAAIATIVARLVLPMVGFWGAVHVRNLVAIPNFKSVITDFPAMAGVAGPAILTNLASPAGNSFAMSIYAQFGPAIVAAFAIVDRLTPLAFCGLFSLTASIGPIIGQNIGALRYDRVRETMANCFKVSCIYVILVWLALYLCAPLIADLFKAQGDTRDFLIFYCNYGSALFLFLGLIFVANASFNNLGFPLLATLFNWGRATLGTIPFVTLGARYYGPKGGYMGLVVGAVVFGLAAIIASRRVVARLERAHAKPPAIDTPV